MADPVTAAGGELLIDAKNIVKDYPIGDSVYNALKGVGLTVRRGEFLAIMGPSGSGKSTLMHLLGCLDTPTSGEYRFAGNVVNELTPDQLAELRNREIGFVFQMFFLLPRSNALENVELPLIYGKVPPAERRKKAMEALEFLGLQTHANHRPSQLSGGQRQQIAIARALVNKPSLILADEPTGNLDSKTSEHIMGQLVRLNEMGNTLIVVTHEAEIAAYAPRQVRIKDGLITSDEVTR